MPERNIISGLRVSDNNLEQYNKDPQEVISPINGELIGIVNNCSIYDADRAIKILRSNSNDWKKVPAPIRGELVRRVGEKVRIAKELIANTIVEEMGKTKQEALGEVQEWIDICDFAVGLSRQLHGLNIASERPDHRLLEQWQPLGVVGIISAFNFPVAVWAWNAMLALVCGNTIIWKPSEKTPLCAHLCHTLLESAIVSMRNEIPTGISAIVSGDEHVARYIAGSADMISATGSTQMGKEIANIVSQKLGKSLLELGGNNAAILSDKADLDLALRAITFSVIGTSGQRCTTLRRLYIHKNIQITLIEKLIRVFKNVSIGDPRQDGILMGPLINKKSFDKMQEVLNGLRNTCVIFGGNSITENVPSGGYYVKPAIVLVPFKNENGVITSTPPKEMSEETFAPILYIQYYNDLEEAIKLNNDSQYGLSSCIFTNDLRESELFLSSLGSDCGIANVNIGTSGAEIGGAFGGEKDTGGGRESGSDCWKNYMRRQTVTINYGKGLPLSQGIKFDLD